MIQFRKVEALPSTLRPRAVEEAVAAFVEESGALDIPLDPDGLYNQLIENIASVVTFKVPGRYFWLAEDKGRVIAFALTHIAKDVDNKLCYWQTDAWVDKEWRFRSEVKAWNKILEEDAKANFCQHIIIPASREPKAYCRFLGKGWHTYVTLLKKDL